MGISLLDSYLETGGKPSTWFPPEGLVEQSSSTNSHTNKNANTQPSCKATRETNNSRSKPKHESSNNCSNCTITSASGQSETVIVCNATSESLQDHEFKIIW